MINPILITPVIAAQVMAGEYHGDAAGGSTPVTSFILDNREARPGAMFFALKGERTDGHKYAPAALAAGAVCCVCERPIEKEPYILVSNVQAALQALAAWYRKQLTLPIVAVVGSVGKTTAKEMIAAVLSVRFHTHKTPKNLNSQLGVPLTVLAIQPQHEAAVIEMGISEFGQMDTLGAVVQPDMVVFTTVASCHLEFLGDLAGVLRAKGEIFPHTKRDGLAILSGDDAYLRDFNPGIAKYTFGASEGCDYRVLDAKPQGFTGIEFRLSTPQGEIPGEIPAFGQHLPLSAAAAAAVGQRLGMTAEEIAQGFTRYTAVGGRANVKCTDYLTVIDDCYNASPAAVAASLRSLCAQPGNRVAILGDMKELGPDSPKYHRETGALAASLPLSAILCCGPESAPMYEGAASGSAPAFYYADKAALLADLENRISRDDLVLVKASHSMGFDEIVARLLELS